MERLPVEVVGNILSKLGGARDVVIASETCRNRLEILITQTIFQTTGLQGLSILMDDVDDFSASTVIAWLLYTRETFRRLFYNVRTTPNVNILDICGRQKLEILALSHTLFCQYLRTGSRSFAYCMPKIEILELVNSDIAMSDTQVTVELNSPTLKCIYVEAISLDKFIIEADSIECLHLKDCGLDDVSFIHLDIGETVDNLEIVDVSNFTIFWPKFYQMISKLSRLRKLRLWDVAFDDEEKIVDLETIAVCFPQLTIFLWLGWTVINDLFSHWIEGLVERCQNLKKLVIHGIVSEAKSLEECQMLANVTSSMVQLMRKYKDVDVQFEYI
ncbi:hypothetical protein K2173_013875 [Erythroxylum novogranatense]|uniref:F-box domain-containing protein n=1 Tax=Erythroxylum novogranatense TaxID=1862640 RepID=A0AAV8SD47_9ROSI|nr:hypothetical protein K2173_013875 [Erythroxylum novogranatense]